MSALSEKQIRPAKVEKVMKFTRASLAALPSWSREYVVWDSVENGLAIRVSPKGLKSYFFLGRVGGASKRVNLGRADRRTLDDVRQDARDLWANKDASAAVAFAARGIKVKEAFDEFLKSPTRRGKAKTADTIKGYKYDFGSHVSERLGERYVSGLQRYDVEAIVQGTIDAGHSAMAAKVRRTLTAFINFCRLNGWHKGDHPCAGVIKPEVAPRTRYLTRDELARLSLALETSPVNPFAKAAIRLMLLLGLRRGEALKLKWSHVDFETGTLTLPHAKGKARVVMLNEPAKMLLQSLPRMSGNEFAFPGAVDGEPLKDIRKPFEAICANAAIDDLRRHDLRRTFGCVALQNGATMEEVAALLGHSSIAVTQASYAFLGSREKAAASAKVGTAMTRLLEAEAKASNVVKLAART